MSFMMADQHPRVKPAGRVLLRPAYGDATDGPKRTGGFTKAPHDVLERSDLSDAAVRLWLALQRFTWRGQHPENAELARACGWVNAEGLPATSKVKRLLRDLVQAGMVERRVCVRDGCNVRTLLRPLGVAETDTEPAGGGSNLDHPRAEDGPRDGSNPHRGGGSNLDRSSKTRCRKTDQDSPRPAGTGAGEGIPPTTTTAEPPAIPPGLPPRPTPATAGGTESPGGADAPPTGLRAMLAKLAEARRPDLGRPMPPPVACPSSPVQARPASARAEVPALPSAAEPPLGTDQRRFLSGLRPELRAVFDGESARSRGSILAKFDLGADYALVSSDMEALLERRLRVASTPPRRVTTPEQDPRSLMEAAASGDCVAPVHLAQRLVQDFGGDQKSRRAFEKLGKDLLLGTRTVDEAWHAYTRAMSPASRNRGAIFHVELRQSVASRAEA